MPIPKAQLNVYKTHHLSSLVPANQKERERERKRDKEKKWRLHGQPKSPGNSEVVAGVTAPRVHASLVTNVRCSKKSPGTTIFLSLALAIHKFSITF